MARRLWIVWLMLALLPLRGWAVASMAMGSLPSVVVASSPATVVAEAPVTHATVTAMPCHEASGEGGGGETGHACTLCDLCHSAASVATEIALPSSPLPDALPRPAMAHDTGLAAVGGLDRPPRIVDTLFTA